jgi:hypothetical protein
MTMTQTQKELARECLTWQVLSAKTLTEIKAAQQALRTWIEQYPEEREWMRDGFEQLSIMQDIAEEIEELTPSTRVNA